ncbi:MAG: hypothetical protein ACPGVG_14830, partial [Mycobacterium sp.]
MDKYSVGAKTIENFIVTPEGGLHRRPGTRYGERTAGPGATRSRLIDFSLASDNSYILEFAENVIRVFSGTSRVNIVSREFDNSTGFDATTDELIIPDHGYTTEANSSTNFLFTTSGTLPTGINDVSTYSVVFPDTISGACSAINTGTNELTGSTTPNWQNSMGPFLLSVTEEMPGGLDAFTNYYIRSLSATVFELSLTPGGAAVAITSTGTGTWTLRPTKNYLRDRFRVDSGGIANLFAPGSGTGTIQPFTDDVPTRIDTTYSAAEIADLQVERAPNALYLTHANHRPAQLTHTSDTQWALDDVAFVDGPYLDENTVTTATVTPSSHTLGARTTLTLNVGTATAPGGFDLVNGGKGWQAHSDIGRLIRIRRGDDEPGYVEIDSVTSSTVATGTVLQVIGGAAGAAQYRWSLGAWSELAYSEPSTTTQGNYPASVALSDQRLCFGGEYETPHTITASQPGAFGIMRASTVANPPAVTADMALRFTMFGSTGAGIQWLSVGRKLLVGTTEAIYSVHAAADSALFSPLDVNAVKVSNVGVSSVPPVNVSRHTVFVTRNSQGMRGIEGDDGSDIREEQQPIDLGLLSRHIFGRTSTIEEVSYQFDRRSIVWAVRSDGVLLGCTYLPEQEIYAWHTHKIGG